MLWTISMILLVLWVLGLVSGGTVGSWVHLLLLFAFVSLVLAVARRRRSPPEGRQGLGAGTAGPAKPVDGGGPRA